MSKPKSRLELSASDVSSKEDVFDVYLDTFPKDASGELDSMVEGCWHDYPPCEIWNDAIQAAMNTLNEQGTDPSILKRLITKGD